MPVPPPHGPPTAPARADASAPPAPPELADAYRRFAAVVHGLALAYVGPDEADDVVQDVFVKAASALPTLRDPAALPGWLCALARHRALDRLRARRRRREAPASEASLAALPARDAGAGRSLGDEPERALRLRVLALLQRLPEVYREALVLRLVEGLDGPTIAARTGRTPGSVRVHLHRGLELLRPLLKAEGWA